MKYIDLSHPITNSISTYPSDPKVLIIKEKEIEKDRTLLHSFKMGTHTGTHLDAPAHIINGGKTLDKFTLDSFCGKTIKVNKNNFKSLLSLEKNIDGVIYDTGWYKNFNNPKKFFNKDRPLIAEELLDLIDNLNLKFFGCDLPSVDKSGSKSKKVHNKILGQDIIIYEALANLNKIPELEIFDFFGFPFAFKNLDGSPVRAVASL